MTVLIVFHDRRIIRKDSIWDKIVFKTVQAALGGRVRLITTGSAPLAPKVLSFLRCIVGCPVSSMLPVHLLCCLGGGGGGSEGEKEKENISEIFKLQ